MAPAGLGGTPLPALHWSVEVLASQLHMNRPISSWIEPWFLGLEVVFVLLARSVMELSVPSCFMSDVSVVGLRLAHDEGLFLGTDGSCFC